MKVSVVESGSAASRFDVFSVTVWPSLTGSEFAVSDGGSFTALIEIANVPFVDTVPSETEKANESLVVSLPS